MWSKYVQRSNKMRTSFIIKRQKRDFVVSPKKEKNSQPSQLNLEKKTRFHIFTRNYYKFSFVIRTPLFLHSNSFSKLNFHSHFYSPAQFLWTADIIDGAQFHHLNGFCWNSILCCYIPKWFVMVYCFESSNKFLLLISFCLIADHRQYVVKKVIFMLTLLSAD